MAGERLLSWWQFDRLYLFAIALYTALALAFAWHFIATYLQPQALPASDSAPLFPS